jgi:hypothetical protein
MGKEENQSSGNTKIATKTDLTAAKKYPQMCTRRPPARPVRKAEQMGPIKQTHTMCFPEERPVFAFSLGCLGRCAFKLENAVCI